MVSYRVCSEIGRGAKWLKNNYVGRARKLADGCSWSSCFQPVEGWTAEKVHRKTYDSYRITKCPEYVPDKQAILKTRKRHE